jgi:hypothetical protein
MTTLRCISPPSTTMDSPTVNGYYQTASINARATARFDNAVDACYGYFDAQGYSALARVLSGSNGKNESVLGWQFCNNMDMGLRPTSTATPTTSYLNAYTTPGLPYTIGSPTPYGQCYAVYNTHSGTSKGTRMSTITTFNRTVLVCQLTSEYFEPI